MGHARLSRIVVGAGAARDKVSRAKRVGARENILDGREGG